MFELKKRLLNELIGSMILYVEFQSVLEKLQHFTLNIKYNNKKYANEE